MVNVAKKKFNKCYINTSRLKNYQNTCHTQKPDDVQQNIVVYIPKPPMYENEIKKLEKQLREQEQQINEQINQQSSCIQQLNQQNKSIQQYMQQQNQNMQQQMKQMIIQTTNMNNQLYQQVQEICNTQNQKYNILEIDFQKMQVNDHQQQTVLTQEIKNNE